MNNNDEKSKIENDAEKTVKEEVSSSDFIREKINERPVNKKKFARKILLTASMAVVFGTIACLSFLVMEPLFEKFISGAGKDETVLTQVTLALEEEEGESEEVTAQISEKPFDEEIDVEETPIENLNFDDGVSSNAVSENNLAKEAIKKLELDDYQLLYRKMYSLSREVSKSIVVVTAADTVQDVFNDEYLNTDRTTGLIIANTGFDLFILADGKNLSNKNLTVTFFDGTVVTASEKAYDEETGLEILSVRYQSIPSETRDVITLATLGSSASVSLVGSPIIAIGDILSTGNAVCYGAITSTDNKVYGLDVSYQLINTDIFGNSNANGVLVNVRGQVIGIICQRYNSDEMKNMVSAFGISGIRRLMENLSNNQQIPYAGLYLKDVPKEAIVAMNIPAGAYVSKVEMDSPAMQVGIIPGDIIVGINDKLVTSVNDYTTGLRDLEEGAKVKIKIMRLNGEEYKANEVEIEIAFR